MSRHRLTVVLSQAQGKHPAKRALEESIVAALLMEPGLDVSVIPHLYDLHAEHTGRLFLESVTGEWSCLSWLFPRAAFWVLDRDGIKGHWGETQLGPPTPTATRKTQRRSRPRALGPWTCRSERSTASTCATATITSRSCRRFAGSPPSAGHAREAKQAAGAGAARLSARARAERTRRSRRSRCCERRAGAGIR